MTDRRVYIDRLGTQARVAVVEDGRLVELSVQSEGRRQLVGNVYLGRVVNVVDGLRAAFVDIGLDKNGFLPLDDMPSAARDAAEPVTVPRRKLRGAQEIIVQVVREPGGDKGPRLTMNPSFPGKYAVLLPTVEAVGVSRHIEEPARRAALEALGRSIRPDGMGLILRTAAEEATDAEIAEDVDALCTRWAALVQAARTRKAPALLQSDDDPALRAARDLNAEVIEGAFDDALEAKIEKALHRRVWLKSGAYLVFDVCEAMTVIDVNSGKSAGKRDHEESILRLNCEAAREIARQVRLRDVGGIIVVDFVDMQREESRAQVLAALEEGMQPDRAKRHIFGFTSAGLLEMTRRPVFRPLAATLQTPCAACSGTGWTVSAEERAHRLLRDVRRRRSSGDESEITLRVSHEVAEALRAAGAEEMQAVHIQEMDK